MHRSPHFSANTPPSTGTHCLDCACKDKANIALKITEKTELTNVCYKPSLKYTRSHACTSSSLHQLHSPKQAAIRKRKGMSMAPKLHGPRAKKQLESIPFDEVPRCTLHLIIPLTQGWIFNECNCRLIAGHNFVK